MFIHESSRTDERGEQPAPMLTFKQLLDAMARDDKLTPKRSADIRSGVRSLLRALGLQIESTPVEPRAIGERLRGLTPAEAKMSPARLQNCRCLMDAAFAIADRQFGRRRNFKAMAAPYSALVDLIPDSWELRRLRRVFHFASEHNVDPQDIDSAFFDGFLRHLQRTTLPDPRTIDREARKGWNRMCVTVPGWPGKPVMVPSYVDHWVLPEEEFPPSLLSDLDAYLKSRNAKNAIEIDDLLNEEELFGEDGETRNNSPLITLVNDTLRRLKPVRVADHLILFTSRLLRRGFRRGGCNVVATLAVNVDP